MINEIQAWLVNNQLPLFGTFVALIAYVVMTRNIFPLIDRTIDAGNYKYSSMNRAYHLVRLLSGVITLVILLSIWGVDISGLLILSTSLLTITGVALFANWSVLSNVTAYLIILFHLSYKRGNFIRIVEGDNYVEGYISEIGLFNVKLITEDREVILYPNNLVLTRVAIVNPKNHFYGMGKIKEVERITKESD